MYAFVNFIITPLTELFEILVDVQLTMICRKASFPENNSLWFHLGDVAITFLDYKGSGYGNMISDDRWRMAYRWERNPVDHSVTLSIVRLEEEPLSLTIDQVATPQWWDTNKSRGKEMRFAATGRVKNGGWEPNLVAVWTDTKAATSSNAWSGIFYHAGSGLFLGDNRDDHKAVLLIKEPEVIK